MYVHMTVVLKCAFAVDLNSVNVNFINEFDQDNSSHLLLKTITYSGAWADADSDPRSHYMAYSQIVQRHALTRRLRNGKPRAHGYSPNTYYYNCYVYLFTIILLF